MLSQQPRRWCLFTSAGDRNAIHLWLDGNAPRMWDLVVAYYGDDDDAFCKISDLCIYSFRSKGSKFQNLKKLILEKPDFFDSYSHVWVCDDDILMSSEQVHQAFSLTVLLGFWVTQPAFDKRGKISHWIGCFVGARWDYRIVNFVEVTMPIFRREKLTDFLAVYDGSLVGHGIDYWVTNFLQADEFARFAVIDKVKVINPRDASKGGRVIDQLQSEAQRKATWRAAQKKYGLNEYALKVFAYCKLAPKQDALYGFAELKDFRIISVAFLALWDTLRQSGWREAAWLLKCGVSIFLQRWRAHNSFR
jgi:hypothetical protein